jgi:hypothetical protein
MGLLNLTQTSSGSSFSMDDKHITKVYENGTTSTIEYVDGSLKTKKSIIVNETLTEIYALSTSLMLVVIDGKDVYINKERVSGTTEIDSLAVIYYDNARASIEKLTLATTEAVFLTALNLAAPQYKIYKALLTQTGTLDPTAVVLANTLGGTIVWSYATVGGYLGTLVGAFPDEEKVDPTVGNGGLIIDTSIVWIDADSVRIRTSNGTAASDAKLSNTPVTILVKI